jgi:hypothetical protein
LTLLEPLTRLETLTRLRRDCHCHSQAKQHNC